MIDFSAELNTQQLQAVQHENGPLLILAGAGTGKTKTLTYRIAWLILSQKANPENILAVTFTNKAAGEMKERLYGLLGDKAYRITAGTFHSFGLNIMKAFPYLVERRPYFTIYDDYARNNVFKNLLERNPELKSDLEKLKIDQITLGDIETEISHCKNNLLKPEDIQDFIEYQSLTKKIYPLYEAYLKENNAVDFDDLIKKPCELFQKNDNILQQYQERYSWIFIDEYQDVNYAQYLLSFLLAKKYHQITVVGDDAQSIYGFRGADINNILDFINDYSGATQIKLEQNYRSHQLILDAGNNLIEKNTLRIKKNLWSEQKEGPEVQFLEYYDEAVEAYNVIRSVQELHGTYDFKDMAILVRTHAISNIIESELLAHGIPYIMYGGKKLLERKEVRDLVAYMQLIINPFNEQAFTRSIQIPRRKIGKTTIEKIIQFSRTRNIDLLKAIEQYVDTERISVNQKENLLSYVKLIYRWGDLLNEKSLTSVFVDILEDLQFIKYIEEQDDRTKERLENIESLRGRIYHMELEQNSIEGKEILSIFLEEVALSEAQNEEPGKKEGLILSTIHGVKGLEFDVVFVVGLEEGILPHGNALKNQDLDKNAIEEERRLFYVAITRAKNHLFITRTTKRYLYGQTISFMPSRFLQDLQE